MPKLNVQQNNANVIKALRNALAIGQVKGPIASDGADNFSSAGSNRNLLDNPFFTINQRGQASYTGAVFGVDRWTMAGASGSVVVNSGYLTISNVAGSPYLQRLARELKLGKTYTASILLNDGTVNSVTFTTSTQKEYVYQLGNYYFELDARSAYAPNYRFMIYGNSTWTMDIVAAKLELGSVSTLANDVPPEYGTELAKCQYYCPVIDFPTYGSIAVGYATSSTTAYFIISLPANIRTLPTMTYSGSLRVFVPASNSSISVSGLAVAGSANTPCSNQIALSATVASGLTAGQLVVLGGNETAGKIILSAEL